MEITTNNATGLLKELLHNGGKSQNNLYGWFLGERELIKRTIEDIETYEHEKAGIQKIVTALEKTQSLLEDGDRHCYHMAMVKLRLHIHLLKQFLED